MKVSYRSCTVKARVNHDDFRTLFLRFDRPTEANRVSFSRVTTLNNNKIGVFDVNPVICHGTATK
jgi:hypothetical protein